jgi:hypothetical protein
MTLDRINEKMKLLTQKKQRVIKEINEYDRILTWNGELVKRFGSNGPNQLVPDTNAEELHLPPKVIPIKCRVCDEIVQDPMEHYVKGAWPAWPCKEWNHY